jgi:two-component system chemotaxis response regulator CheY
MHQHLSYNAPILIVEDETEMLDLVTRYIRRLGFDSIDHAHDGLQALTMMRGKMHSLVISDLHMEPLNGLELIKIARMDALLYKTRFIMITGDNDLPSMTAADKLGVDAYILKPFSQRQLEAKIRQLATAKPRTAPPRSGYHSGSYGSDEGSTLDVQPKTYSGRLLASPSGFRLGSRFRAR